MKSAEIFFLISFQYIIELMSFFMISFRFSLFSLFPILSILVIWIDTSLNFWELPTGFSKPINPEAL